MDAARHEQDRSICEKSPARIMAGGEAKAPCGIPPVPKIFSPEAVAEKCGYSYEVRDIMPSANRGVRFETAGMIMWADRSLSFLLHFLLKCSGLLRHIKLAICCCTGRYWA
ncbi:hypothetical protein LJR034_005315 [Caballeronia sp. LjRoot34]|uniref:hypothetical protein n=1 Tax=Caballeronia sp. LjRoot34 TaxID=3342325 RepID=UPI003ECC5E4E